MSVKQMSLVWDLELAPNKRLVLLAYADHADEDGNNVFPSLPRIAHKTGYSVDQVRRLSRSLVTDGLMELVDEGRGRGNTYEYRLTLEKGSKLPAFTPKRERKEKVASATKKVASRREKVAPAPPEPSITTKEPSPVGAADAATERRKIEKDPVGFLVDLVKEAKAKGLRPPPLTPKQRGEYGQFAKQALLDGEPSERCEDALRWLVSKASGEIEGQKKAWAYFGTALDAAVSDEPQNVTPIHVSHMSYEERERQKQQEGESAVAKFEEWERKQRERRGA